MPRGAAPDLARINPELGRSKGRLPEPLTDLIGRAGELAEIERLLTHARMITLTGPGGVGKTQLALHAAHRFAGAFADGAYLVDLTGVTRADQVTGALAST